MITPPPIRDDERDAAYRPSRLRPLRHLLPLGHGAAGVPPARGDEIQCAVPFYGRGAEGGDVQRIRPRLLLQYAEKDEYVNQTMSTYQAELKKYGVRFDAHVYPGTQHGFHNDSTPRYDAAAAELAWKRTLDVFAMTLA